MQYLYNILGNDANQWISTLPQLLHAQAYAYKTMKSDKQNKSTLK